MLRRRAAALTTIASLASPRTRRRSPRKPQPCRRGHRRTHNQCCAHLGNGPDSRQEHTGPLLPALVLAQLRGLRGHRTHAVVRPLLVPADLVHVVRADLDVVQTKVDRAADVEPAEYLGCRGDAAILLDEAPAQRQIAAAVEPWRSTRYELGRDLGLVPVDQFNRRILAANPGRQERAILRGQLIKIMHQATQRSIVHLVQHGGDVLPESRFGRRLGHRGMMVSRCGGTAFGEALSTHTATATAHPARSASLSRAGRTDRPVSSPKWYVDAPQFSSLAVRVSDLGTSADHAGAFRFVTEPAATGTIRVARSGIALASR